MSNINTNNRRNSRIFSGVFWRLGERILAQVVSLVVSIILARILLPEQYGIISVILIFIAFADVFVTSGFSAALIQKKDAKEIDFNSIFYCSLFVSVAIYVLLFFAAPFISSFYNMPDLTAVLRIFSLRIIISSYNSVQHAYVSRHMIFKKFFFSTLFGTIASGVVGILMALSGYGVWALVAQYLTNTIIDSIILTITIKWRPKLQFSKKSARELMRYGWKVLAADLSGTFFDQLRSLIIGKIYTPADLALYDKGKQFPSVIIDNANTSIMSVLFPAISNENNNKESVKELTQRSIIIISYVIIPLSMMLCAVAHPLVDFLLTSKWTDTAIYMQLLSFTAAVSLTSNISLQTIKAMGHSDILLKLELVKKPVYIILLLIGAHFSVLGVAITSVIYALYGTFVNSRAMGKIIDYSVFKQIRDMLPNFILAFTIFGAMLPITLLPIPSIMVLIIQAVIGIIIFIVGSKLFKLKGFSYVLQLLKSYIRRKNVKD